MSCFKYSPQRVMRERLNKLGLGLIKKDLNSFIATRKIGNKENLIYHTRKASHIQNLVNYLYINWKEGNTDTDYFKEKIKCFKEFLFCEGVDINPLLKVIEEKVEIPIKPCEDIVPYELIQENIHLDFQPEDLSLPFEINDIYFINCCEDALIGIYSIDFSDVPNEDLEIETTYNTFKIKGKILRPTESGTRLARVVFSICGQQFNKSLYFNLTLL